MTNDAIDRAIKRGTGERRGTYEAITYEGYAPGGVAILVDVLTDNRNRTGAEIRNIFTQAGRLAGRAGRGQLAVRPAGHLRVAARLGEDALMLAALEAGADDVADDGALGASRRPRRRSTSASHSTRPASPSSRPTRRWSRRTSSRSQSVEEAKRVLRVVEALEDNEDVQDVFANFDIADDVMTEVVSMVLAGRGSAGRPAGGR